MSGRDPQRLRFRFGFAPPVKASVHAENISFVARVIAVLDWRFASAATRPRALLAMVFAPLSHALMNGFFFSQGLAMRCSSRQPSSVRAGAGSIGPRGVAV